MEDAEDLVGIDGAQRQIVVGVSAVVEMEAADHFVMQQPGHDLLDVLGLIVMAGIHQNVSLRTRRARQQESHAPVGNVGVIKGGLERLVLDQQALLRTQSGMQRFLSASSNHPILFRMLWVPG